MYQKATLCNDRWRLLLVGPHGHDGQAVSVALPIWVARGSGGMVEVGGRRVWAEAGCLVSCCKLGCPGRGAKAPTSLAVSLLPTIEV